jgi:hypothetical protein
MFLTSPLNNLQTPASLASSLNQEVLYDNPNNQPYVPRSSPFSCVLWQQTDYTVLTHRNQSTKNVHKYKSTKKKYQRRKIIHKNKNTTKDTNRYNPTHISTLSHHTFLFLYTYTIPLPSNE